MKDTYHAGFTQKHADHGVVGAEGHSSSSVTLRHNGMELPRDYIKGTRANTYAQTMQT
jgi:hypothetical protein